MKYAIRVRPEVGEEIREHARYYNGEVPNLGRRYFHAASRTIDSLETMPAKHPVALADIRMAQVRPFPFGVFFLIEETEVIVLALLDLRRDPERRSRLLRRRAADD